LAVTAERTMSGGSGGGSVPLKQRLQLGRFVILRQLGAGGMGTVFAAYDEQLDRKVALKILHVQDSGSHVQRERTLREAKALARVTHPRVVSVYEVGETDGQLYLTMEFIDGVTLRSWQSARKRPWREVLQMYLRAGEGLRAAHDAGVVHRDFKPDNVLVGNDGLPRVVDFGVARLNCQQPGEHATQEAGAGGSSECAFTFHGVISGTPGYMSPEQLEGGAIDAASDQFSFCAALYEALCGYLPFPGQTAAEQAQSVRGTMPLPPPGTPVPEEVFRILARGMATDPAARFSSMGALLGALAIEHGQSASGAGLSRQRTLVALAVLCVLLIPVLQYFSDRHARMTRQAIGTSLVVIFVTILAGYTQRRALLTNAFHRRIWTLLLINFFQNMFVRVVVLRHQVIPFQAVFSMEMIVWAGTTTSLATLPVRTMWWLPLIPVLIGGTAFYFGNLPRSLLLFTYPLLLLSVLWTWHRAAKQAQGASASTRRDDRCAMHEPPVASRTDLPGGSAD
jgi:predicted Ser/Thr protein kinase